MQGQGGGVVNLEVGSAGHAVELVQVVGQDAGFMTALAQIGQRANRSLAATAGGIGVWSTGAHSATGAPFNTSTSSTQLSISRNSTSGL